MVYIAHTIFYAFCTTTRLLFQNCSVPPQLVAVSHVTPGLSQNLCLYQLTQELQAVYRYNTDAFVCYSICVSICHVCAATTKCALLALPEAIRGVLFRFVTWLQPGQMQTATVPYTRHHSYCIDRSMS